MSPSRIKSRQSANPTDHVTPTVNEKILRECYSLYTNPEKGLIAVAGHFGVKLYAPRKKIIILLIGNHSAGKSSFINWYIEEHVLKTSVAIETQGFTIVTSGTKRESLLGNATLHLYPHFKPLQKLEGVVNFLSTEISTSKQKKFSLVTFVDTPGLVDGDMLYPFDVNEAIFWLGTDADLIFTFFDPIGQALCKRTLSVVERLNNDHPDKMRFYLSKADDAGDESDRQRVMMQIVQELCKKPGLNRTCFDMPAIYIPDMNKCNVRCANQIESVCIDIERTINRTIQNTLDALERDSQQLLNLVCKKLSDDQDSRSHNFHTYVISLFIGVMAILIPIILFSNLNKKEGPVFSWLSPTPSPTPSDSPPYWILGVSCATLIFVKWFFVTKPTLSRKERRYCTEVQNHIQTVIKPRKEQLYTEYLEQSVGDHGL